MLLHQNVYFGALDDVAVEVGFAHKFKGNYTALNRIDSMVFAKLYVGPRHHFGTALAHDNGARLGKLAGKELNAKVLSVRIG